VIISTAKPEAPGKSHAVSNVGTVITNPAKMRVDVYMTVWNEVLSEWFDLE
jgi:hypothetical protein